MSSPEKKTPIMPSHEVLARLANEPQDGWSVVNEKGARRLRTPTKGKYTLCKIGEGAFVTAYSIVEHPDVVVAQVHDIDGKQLDYSKTLLTEILRNGIANPHLPHVFYCGDTKNSQLFAMPKYRVPLTRRQATAFAIGEILRGCRETGIDKIRDRKGSFDLTKRGDKARRETIACARANGGVPAGVLEALQTISDFADLWTRNNVFEFQNRNLGTDSAGNLILLDVLFDIEAHDKLHGRQNRSPQDSQSPWVMWFENLIAPGRLV